MYHWWPAIRYRILVPKQATRARRALQQQYRYPEAFSCQRKKAACIAGSEDEYRRTRDEDPVKHTPYGMRTDVILKQIILDGNTKFPKLSDTARKARVYLFSLACPIKGRTALSMSMALPLRFATSDAATFRVRNWKR